MDTPRIRFFGCRLILVQFLQTFSTGWTTLIQQQRDKTMAIHHGGQMKPKLVSLLTEVNRITNVNVLDSMVEVPSQSESSLSSHKFTQYCRVIFPHFWATISVYFSSPKTIISGQILIEIYLILPIATAKVANGVSDQLLCPFTLACHVSQPRMHLKIIDMGIYSSTNHCNKSATISQHPKGSNESDGISKYLKIFVA